MAREDDLHIVIREGTNPRISKAMQSGREVWYIQGSTHREVAELFLNWWEEQGRDGSVVSE